MKYYLYISQTKVDMLFAQIPIPLRNKIAAEIKIKTPLVNVSFKDKEMQSTESLYAKLSLVVQYIEKHLEVGTFSSPRAYLKDTLPMRWAQIGVGLAYFSCSTKRVILGLGGSSHHLIGRKGEGSTDLDPSSHSNDHQIIDRLSKALRISDSVGFKDSDTFDDLVKSSANRALYAVEKAADAIQGPVHRLEFLARKLAIEDTTSKKVILGTPVYIAFAD